MRSDHNFYNKEFVEVQTIVQFIYHRYLWRIFNLMPLWVYILISFSLLLILTFSCRPKVKNKEVIVDFGCGQAKIAQTLDKDRFKIFSFDLVAVNNYVTACDMAHTNLFNNSVDIVVFCLSLMSSNISDCVKEANRVLKEEYVL